MGTRSSLRLLVLIIVATFACGGLSAQSEFVRSDCNGDGFVNIADPMFLLQFLFQPGTVPQCDAACDSSGDNAIDIADAIYSLSHQLLGGNAPVPPFPDCGPPTSTVLSCDFYDCTAPPAPTPDPGFVLSLTDQAVGVPGSLVAIDVTLDSAAPIQGWSWGVCHDNPIVEVQEIAVGADAATVNGGNPPDFESSAIVPGEGWTVGLLIALIGPETLAAGNALELHVATYLVLDNGVVNLSFCDTLGLPPVPTILIQEGLGLAPTTVDGSILAGVPPPPDDSFLRGDCDGNNVFNGLVDSLFLLQFQFGGGTTPPCLEAADVDGNGMVNGLVDALYALNHQFGGGPQPPAPYPSCAADPDPSTSVGCATPSC